MADPNGVLEIPWPFFQFDNQYLHGKGGLLLQFLRVLRVENLHHVRTAGHFFLEIEQQKNEEEETTQRKQSRKTHLSYRKQEVKEEKNTKDIGSVGGI